MEASRFTAQRLILIWTTEWLCMFFAVAGLLCDGPLSIKGGDCVKISYPEFYEDLYRLGE